jgi:hypothetical protein
MNALKKALERLNFRWTPKHLNHIAENIAIKKRNISFLAINALFRQKTFEIAKSASFYSDSYIIKGKVPLQKNDLLRTIEDELIVVFRLDRELNIIVITAYSSSDEF